MVDIKTDEYKTKFNPWIVSIPIIGAAFMFVLDETIANVALPHMAGTFSASHDESLWILTSYLVASGTIIPAVDFFSKLIGRKQYYMLSIVIFTVASKDSRLGNCPFAADTIPCLRMSFARIR